MLSPLSIQFLVCDFESGVIPPCQTPAHPYIFPAVLCCTLVPKLEQILLNSRSLCCNLRLGLNWQEALIVCRVGVSADSREHMFYMAICFRDDVSLMLLRLLCFVRKFLKVFCEVYLHFRTASLIVVEFNCFSLIPTSFFLFILCPVHFICSRQTRTAWALLSRSLYASHSFI